jgi:hypothetical protein
MPDSLMDAVWPDRDAGQRFWICLVAGLGLLLLAYLLAPRPEESRQCKPARTAGTAPDPLGFWTFVSSFTRHLPPAPEASRTRRFRPPCPPACRGQPANPCRAPRALQEANRHADRDMSLRDQSEIVEFR